MISDKVIQIWVRKGDIERLKEKGYDSKGNFIDDNVKKSFEEVENFKQDFINEVIYAH